MTDPSELVSALDRCRQQLHALPGVVGTGVGLRAGKPVVEIFVAGQEARNLEQAVRKIVDFDFVIVPESPIPEAQQREED